LTAAGAARHTHAYPVAPDLRTMPEDRSPDPPRGFPRLSLLHCAECGRARVCNRVDLQGYARAAWPRCCGLDLDLYILAERPGPEDAVVVALPLPLPGSNDGTAVIPRPPERKPDA
jgi:hypothetical protein